MLQVELVGAVRGAVELMRSTLTRLAVAVSHEDPSHPELQMLEDAMKVLLMQAEKLASTYLGESVRSLDELDPKNRQQDDQLLLLQRVKARHVMHRVRNMLVVQMRDEVKELHRRLAIFQDGCHTLVELEKADREQIAAQVQRMDEHIAAHKEYTALVHHDLKHNGSEFRRFISRLEHALSMLENKFEDLEERAKDWAIYRTYEIFLNECKQVFAAAIAGMECAPTADIRRSPALQKAVRDGMNVAAVSLLLHLHGRITGSLVCGPETELVDVEARIGDLEHKIVLHHDEVKLQADNLRLSVIDTKKSNDMLKVKLQTCHNHIQELQQLMDHREKHSEVLSEDSP